MKNDTKNYVTRLLAIVMKQYGATPLFKVIVKKNGDITVSSCFKRSKLLHRNDNMEVLYGFISKTNEKSYNLIKQLSRHFNKIWKKQLYKKLYLIMVGAIKYLLYFQILPGSFLIIMTK